MGIGGQLLVSHGLAQRLARIVVRQRLHAFGSVAEVQEHQDLLVLRQAQGFCQLVRVEEVDPAAVHALVGGGRIM